jgi:hypothetical protein
LALGEEKKLNETFFAEITKKEVPLTITGLIVSVVTNPVFYIPVSIVVLLVILRLLKKSGTTTSTEPIRPKSDLKRPAPRRKSFYDKALSYEQWEAVRRKA